MSEMRRLLDENGSDAATRLLRSATFDRAPAHGKASVLAALGLEEAPFAAPPKSVRPRRSARPSPAPLFQSVLGPMGMFEGQRLGALVASASAALVALTLLASPLRTSHEKQSTRRSYPELAFGHGPAAANAGEKAEPGALGEYELAALEGPNQIGGRDPVFTPEAIAAGASGAAIVECLITEEGTTKDCRILRSMPHMDAELLAAAATWTFEPATQGGRPIAVRQAFEVEPTQPK